MDVRNLEQAVAFITKDGSEIRELLAYRNSVIRHQSLAEARVAPGATTTPHLHPKSEEIYYILDGVGLMQLAHEQRAVGALDAIAIPPGVAHQITNTGDRPLRFLCCCSPAYEDSDTVLLDAMPDSTSTHHEG